MKSLRMGGKGYSLIEVSSRSMTNEERFKSDIIQVIDHYRGVLSQDDLIEYLWHTIDNENEDQHGKS